MVSNLHELTIAVRTSQVCLPSQDSLAVAEEAARIFGMPWWQAAKVPQVISILLEASGDACSFYMLLGEILNVNMDIDICDSTICETCILVECFPHAQSTGLLSFSGNFSFHFDFFVG